MAKNTSFWVIFLFVSCLGVVKVTSVNLYVNASLTEASGSTYPSLSTAITQLMNGGLDSTNTITLYSSCLTVPQTLPSGLNIHGTSSQSITIQYLANRTIAQSQDCQLLPILIISSNQIFNVTNLAAFTLIGLNIQFYGSTYQNSIYSMGAVSFSNFCFNNSEPTLTDPNSSYPSNYTPYFYLWSLSSFSMMNGVWLFDGFKEFSVSNTISTTVASVVFEALNSTRPSHLPTFFVRDWYYNTALDMSNIQLIVDTGSFVGPNVIVIYGLPNVTLSGFTFSNLMMTTANQGDAISVEGGGTLLMDNFTFHNTTFSLHNYFFWIDSVWSSTLSNFDFDSINITTLVAFNDWTWEKYVKPGVQIVNWSFKNMSLAADPRGFIYYWTFGSNSSDLWDFGTLQFQNLSILNSNFDSGSNFLQASTFNAYSNESWYHSNSHPIQIDGFTMTGSTMNQAQLFNATYTLRYVPAIYVIHFELSNANITNNTFTQSSLVIGDGVAVVAWNLLVANNTLETSILFSALKAKSSLIVYDSVFTNLNMSTQSEIIANNMTSYLVYGVEEIMSIHEKGLYAETSPLILYSCSFSNIILESNSVLILSANSMVIIQNNTFQQVTLIDSILLAIGEYPLFWTEESFFVDIYWNLEFPNYDVLAGFSSYPFSESALFRDTPFCQDLFDRARERINGFNPLGAILFMNVENNTFTTLQVFQSSSLIILNSFQVPNSTITIINNTFTSITCDTELNIFSASDMMGLIFANNSFNNINLYGYTMYLEASQMILNAFLANSFNDTNQLAFYKAEVDQCVNMTIDGVQAWNIHPSQSFITLSCNAYTNPIVVQNSNFSNIVLANTPGILQELNFIYIVINEAPQDGNGTIYFNNNWLQNITMNNTEGAIQRIFQISIVLIAAENSMLFFQNNTLDDLTVTPQGTVMTFLMTTIQIVGSNFTNFKFQDPNGAIMTICQNFLVTSCNFQDNQGSNTDGVGLLNIINPVPSQNCLIAQISNSTFESNIGPSSGTILYVEGTRVQLNLTGVSLLNNSVYDTAGLLYLYNIYSSTITFVDCNFVQGSPITLHELQIFAIENPGIDVFMTLKDSSITLGGEAASVIISVSNQDTVMLNISNLAFFPSPDSSDYISSSGFLQFSILKADNIIAVFKNINFDGFNIEAGLFVLNCNTETEFAHMCALTIANSTFGNLALSELSEGLITVNSDNSGSAALDALNISIQNCVFQNISWSSMTGGIVFSSTTLIGKSQGDDFSITILNSSFENLTGTQGFIYNGAESQYDHVLWISQSTFQSLETTGAGGLINPTLLLAQSLGNSNIQGLTYKISESLFQEINSGAGALLYWISNYKGISISIESSSFENMISSGEGGIICSQRRGTVNSSALNQSFINTNLIILSSNNSSYTRISASTGGIIYSDSMSEFLQINVENSTFESITVNSRGGIMQIITSTESSSSGSARRLLQNSNQYTGSIIILGSNFDGISASEGGLMYEQTSNNTLLLNISNNTIQDLSVSDRGGVLFVNQPIISIGNNTFSNCYASVVGPIVYSLGNLDLSGFESANEITNSNYPLYSFAPTNLKISFLFDDQILQPDNNPDFDTNPIYSNLTSYSLSNLILSLSLFHESSQELSSVPDGSAIAIITLVFIPQNGRPNQTHIDTKCVNGSCTVNASDITLQGDPGDVILVNANYSSSLYIQFQQFYMRLRGCLPGEVNYTSTQECVYCGKGTYSINPNSSKCNDCPAGVICEGGSSLFINPGYYRSENSSNVYVMSCNDTATDPICLGGYNNSCIEAYKGPFCSQCNNDNGYLKTPNGCSKCDSKNLLIIYGTLILAGTIVYQIFMITVTFQENHNIHDRYMNDQTLSSKVRPGAFMVIFSSFCQITAIISEFNVGTVLSLFNISINVGDPNSKAFFSIQCLYYLGVPNVSQALQFQLLCYVFSPFIKVAAAFLFEIIRGLLWRDRQGQGLRKAFTRIGAVATVLILLEQPAIVGLLCNYLNCSQLDPYVDKHYIAKYNNIECYTPTYYLTRNALVIPALIFWGLVVPFTLFLIVYTKREKLYTSLGLRLVFGNFYNGYTQQAYYWGCVIMIFKMIVFILNSILNTSDLVKGVVLMCLFHIYYKIFKRNPPYNHEYLNRAEEYCFRTYIGILTLVFFRLASENSTVQNICNVLILLITIYTGGYILVNIFWLHISRVLNIFDRFKVKTEEDKVIRNILRTLENYHDENPNRIDGKQRRGAISLDLPSNFQFSAENELDKIQSNREQRIRNFRRKITRTYTSFFDSFNSKSPTNSAKNTIMKLQKVEEGDKIEEDKFEAPESQNAELKPNPLPLNLFISVAKTPYSHPKLIERSQRTKFSVINLEFDSPRVIASQRDNETT